MNDDEKFMRMALALARHGKGAVEPNPMVGAVIVRNGKVVATGYHRRFGGPHAEIEAIRNAGRSAGGATLYVNLEPCSHHGKTPPCVESVISAGIIRVVAAMKDPNPLVNGKGAARLRKAGIAVVLGPMHREARTLNKDFLRQTARRPYVYAKWAMTMDGKIAARTGDSRWISSPLSRSRARAIRREVQAIIVGVNTTLQDDPLLIPSGSPARHPIRVVLDRKGRTPPTSRLVETARRYPTLIVLSNDAPARREALYRRKGCRTLVLSTITLRETMRHLAAMGCAKVLIEGGGEVHASAFREGVVDEVMIFVAPKIVGGRGAATPVGGDGVTLMRNALRLRDIRVERVGCDLLVRGKVAQ